MRLRTVVIVLFVPAGHYKDLIHNAHHVQYTTKGGTNKNCATLG
jgi:hypothetical protein